MFLFKIEILLNWNFILKEERMNLPVELIVKILVEYHGGYSYRNGKFMTRILAEDERRKLIERVVPHPNKYCMLTDGRVSVSLEISETFENSEIKYYRKYYRLRLYFIEVGDKLVPVTSITLWEQISGIGLVPGAVMIYN